MRLRTRLLTDLQAARVPKGNKTQLPVLFALRLDCFMHQSTEHVLKRRQGITLRFVLAVFVQLYVCLASLGVQALLCSLLCSSLIM